MLNIRSESDNITTAYIVEEGIMGKVLILADKPFLTKKEEKALTSAGILISFSRYSAYNEYLMKAGKLDYDVIVIDDTLRGENIYETCHEIRASSKAKIILLDKIPSSEMWERSKEIGFDHYFKKPIHPHELAEQIISIMGGNGSKADPVPLKNPEPAFFREAAKRYVNPVEQHSIVPAPVIEKPGEINIQGTPDLPATSDNTNMNICSDPKVANLINSLLKGKITKLSPSINLGLGEGFSYIEAENIMGTTSKETAQILESLAKKSILNKQNFEKILVSPTSSVQLIPVEKCPSCDSSELTRGQLIEHFACGHIGLEEEFMHGLNQVCPKCHRELKLIGTDYRKPGMRYICNRCHGIFPAPVIKSRDLKTGETYRLDELHYMSLYTYTLNETSRKQLEFELEPKKQLLDYLIHMGYEVQELVQIQGRSGANHKIDILATMDDIITRHTVAIGILAASQEDTDVPIDPLFNFDSKIYDTGIDHKMVIAVPRFTPEAMKFAQRQGIRVYNLEDLRALLARQVQMTQNTTMGKERLLESVVKLNINRIGPKAWLQWILEGRGYHVEENLKVAGRSGTEHTLDLYAYKDDGIIDHKLVACVITNENAFYNDTSEVMQFDTAAYDAGIRDKILFSVPALSKEARQFAEYQRIKILEAKDFSFLQQNDTEKAVGDLGLKRFAEN
jgi:DNA-binding NarL/FixJ family response regulator